MGKRVQVYDTFPLDHPIRVAPDRRAMALDRISNAWKGEPDPPPRASSIDARDDVRCDCAPCAEKRATAAQDAFNRATPGLRYIARAMVMDGGSGARDAYMARQELAYLRRR